MTCERVPTDTVELTERQRQVLRLAVEGLTDQGIANRLGIAKQTVKEHLMKVYDSLDVDGRIQAVVLAVRLGIDKG